MENNNSINQQPVQQNEVKQIETPQEQKSKKKHSSALVAASKARSAVNHVDAHKISGLSSSFAHTGTNVSYEGE